MRYLIPLLFSFSLLSCGQNKADQQLSEPTKEVISSKEKDLELKEPQNSRDTSEKNAGPSDTTSVEGLVLHIRSEYNRINSLPLIPKKLSFHCDTDGTITYYTNQGKVVKIAIDWGWVGDGSTTNEYYYDDDKLIFSYQVNIGAPANQPDIRTEYRTYVHNDKAIKYMVDEKIRDCRTCQYNRASREYKALQAFQTNKVTTALCN